MPPPIEDKNEKLPVLIADYLFLLSPYPVKLTPQTSSSRQMSDKGVVCPVSTSRRSLCQNGDFHLSRYGHY
jgi:hypothetical protein